MNAVLQAIPRAALHEQVAQRLRQMLVEGQIAPGGVGASEIAKGAVGVSELAALPGARAYRSAPVAIPSGQIVELPMADAAYNQGGVWATNQPTRLTAPVSGVYSITGGVRFEAAGAGTRSAWIVHAGDVNSAFDGQQQPAVTEAGQSTQLSVAAITFLNAGESVSLAVRQYSGGDLQVLGTGQQTALALQFISP